MKPHSIRYVIADHHGRFLVDLFHGKAHWSVAAHDAVTTGHSWLDLAAAKARLLEAQKILGQKLRLSLIDFARIDGRWTAVSQQGVVE